MKRVGYKTMKAKHEAKTNDRTLYDALPTLEEAKSYLGRRYCDEEMEEYWNRYSQNAKRDCYECEEWSIGYEWDIFMLNEHYLPRNRTVQQDGMCGFKISTYMGPVTPFDAGILNHPAIQTHRYYKTPMESW